MVDLLQALRSFLQSLLQPLELPGGVRHVTRDFIGSVVQDSVETHHPQPGLHQLGVEAACGNRTKHKIKLDGSMTRYGFTRSEELLLCLVVII